MIHLIIKNVDIFYYNLLKYQFKKYNIDLNIHQKVNYLNLNKYIEIDDYIIISNTSLICFTKFFFEKITSNNHFYYEDKTLKIEKLKKKSDKEFEIYYTKSNKLPEKTSDIIISENYLQFINMYNQLYSNKITYIDRKYTILDTLTVIFIWKKVSFFEQILTKLLNSIKNSQIIIINYLKEYKYIIDRYSTKDINIKHHLNDDLEELYHNLLNDKVNLLCNTNVNNLILIDNNIIITEPINDLLKYFVDIDLEITSPFLSIYKSYFNNIWFNRDEIGYYKTSPYQTDKNKIFLSVYTNFIVYVNIKNLKKILTKNNILSENNKKNIPISDFDIIFSNFLFNYEIPIYNFNHILDIGYIVEETSYLNDKWINLKDIESNRYLWCKNYLSKEILECLYTDTKPTYEEPIPYLYNISFFSKKFCQEILTLAKECNNWSDGKNNDERIIGGYEHVPTVDVHLHQLDMEKTWNIILEKIISPIVEKFYLGYETKGTNIVFIVKYSINGQSKLRPHHDSSSYTVNISLNDPSEYEGGGAHFISQNFKNTNNSVGNMLLHPGKVTHYHQGLEITKGERYILVGFIE